MTLIKKTGISVAATLFVFLLLNLLLVHHLLATAFESYEKEDVARNTSRVMQTVAATYARLNSQDWSHWTEPYNYLGGTNDAFVDENLEPGTISNIGIDFLLFATPDGVIQFSRRESPETGAVLAHDTSFIPPYLVNPVSADIDLSTIAHTGILSTSQGRMLIATQPVLRSDGSGPATGTMVMGLLLNDAWLQQSILTTHVEFLVHDVQAPELSADIQQTIRQIEANGGDQATTRASGFVHDYRLLRDINGHPALLVDVKTPRDILAQGRQLQFIAAGSVLIAGLIIMLVITCVLRVLVTRPLHGLADHIEFIRNTGEIRPIAQVQSRDEIGLLARQFVSLMKSRKVAEKQSQLLLTVLDRSAKSIAFTDPDGRIHYANSMFDTYLDKITCRKADLDLRQLFEAQGQNPKAYEEMLNTVLSGDAWSTQLACTNEDGSTCEESMQIAPVCESDGEIINLTVFFHDVTEKNAMERRLSQAQKLESIGQLAAGVAHEINTPAQFVGDNMKFLKESFDDLIELLGQLHELTKTQQNSVPTKIIRTALEKADADYLREEIPPAIEQSLDGIKRISTIVRAMKEFSHPGTEQSEIDINQSIRSTVTVASHEWKYVARIELDLADDMPAVHCNAGQLNQVILNILVNAAHAVAKVNECNTDVLGNITIKTSHFDAWAEIRISDNGAGMSEDVKARIFDPFFTTKEVGKGTGQGLSIAYDVIVHKHGGTIVVESESGIGTSFIIRLPVAAQINDIGTLAATG